MRTATTRTEGKTYEDDEEDLRRLSVCCPRLALLVEVGSTRSDVRRARSRLLLLLRALECPEDGVPRRPWYVPGAVARLGFSGIRRAWEHANGGRAPCERSLRRHLSALEDCGAIARAPGDRIPALRSGGVAPRYPDTLYLLEDERDAAWWAGEGAAVLRRAPACRTSPERWRSHFHAWRSRARSRQLDLYEEPRAPLPMPGREQVPADLHQARAAAQAIAFGLRSDLALLLHELQRAGVHPPPAAQARLVAHAGALRRASALFALALSRGDVIRDGWGWVRAAMRRASAAEGEAALERLGAGTTLSGAGPVRIEREVPAAEKPEP